MRTIIAPVFAATLMTLTVPSVVRAQAEANIKSGDADRYKVVTAARPDGKGPRLVDNYYVFLLDSHTGEVFTSVGTGEHWTSYAGGLDIGAFPKGEGWQPPRFSLAIAASQGSEPTLILTNTSTGATYTRSKGGEWTPFVRAFKPN